MNGVLIFLAIVILAVALVFWACWREYLRHFHPDHRVERPQPDNHSHLVPGLVPPASGETRAGSWTTEGKLPPFKPTAVPPAKHKHTFSGSYCESSPDFPNLFTRRCTRCGEEVLFDLNDM